MSRPPTEPAGPASAGAGSSSAPDAAAVHPRVVVAAALLTGSLAPLNSTMIIVALPELLADLGASLTWGSWIVISYLVAMAAVQPLGGALGDRFGRRRMLLVGLGGFGLATLAAALAPTALALVAARTVQAIAGAAAIPNGTALLRTMLPQDRQGRAFGVVGAGIGVAAALGPPLGGVVTGAFDWRWIFAVNLLVLAPALALALRLPRHTAAARAGRFDVAGAGLLLATLVAAALAATVWRADGIPAWTSAVLAALAIVAWAGLRRRSARAEAPVLDLGLLGRPGFLAAGMTVATSNLTMYTVFLAVPMFTAELADWGARDVGLLVAGMSVPMLLLGPVGGAWADRVGRRIPAVSGCAVMAAGVIPLVLASPAWSWPALLAPLLVIGAGIGVSSAPVHAAALAVARAGEAGGAAGLFSTLRYAGSIAGTAGMAAVLGGAPGVEAFRILFALLVAAAVAALVSASRLPRRAGGGREAAEPAPAPAPSTAAR